MRRDHEVTLFASGDSVTSARLVAGTTRALRLNPLVRDAPPHTLLLDEVRKRAADFDVLHFHTDLLHFPLFRDIADRTVTTLHGRLDLPDLPAFYREFRDMPVVSISDHQRPPLPDAGWMATVYHGLPRDIARCYRSPKAPILPSLVAFRRRSGRTAP